MSPPGREIRRPLWGHWRVRVSFRHSDLLTLPLPPPARARGPSNRSVHPHLGLFLVWGVWANSLFNKGCPQSFPGPPGRAKEPTRGATFSDNFFCLPGVRKVGLLGGSICRLPAPLGGLGQIFVQQRLPPELPPRGRAKEPTRAPTFSQKFEKNREPSSGAKT